MENVHFDYGFSVLDEQSPPLGTNQSLRSEIQNPIDLGQSAVPNWFPEDDAFHEAEMFSTGDLESVEPLSFEDVDSYLLQESDRANNLADGIYAPNCPYRRDESFSSILPVAKKFRVVEELSDGLIYKGDSFGSHSYIDADEERDCPLHCFCRLHDQTPEAFTFIAEKFPAQLVVAVYSDYLYSELVRVVASEDLQLKAIGQGNALNGLVLLRSYHTLKTHLSALYSELAINPAAHSLVSEMELLVDGFLADGAVFKSFGYEDLYEHGFLTFELWKKFQQAQLERDISILEEGFYAIDEADDSNELQLPTVHADSFSLESMDVELDDQSNDTPPTFPEPAPGSSLNQELLSLNCPSISKKAAASLLVRAVTEGHEEEVRLLLDRGAAVDGVEVDGSRRRRRRDVPVVEAAKAGHEAVVRLLLDRGAAVDGVEVCGWNRRRDVPVVEAAKAGHVAVVRLLLQRGAALSGIGLAKAAKAGHEAVVRLLLNLGAAVDGVEVDADGWHGRQDVPVVEAAKAGHGAVVRLLLQRGAAVSALESLGLPAARRKIQEKDRKFRRLHKQFVQQHRLMMEAAQHSSTEFRELSERFKNYREAWAAGIRTMRRLCNSRPPRNLDNTVAFLCISRAISETLDTTDACDYKCQFLQDLDRWQVLFTSKASLYAYREAIHSMWGVTLDENKSRPRDFFDIKILTHFQTLASTLIRQTSESFDFHRLGDGGLERSQQRCRLRNSQILSNPEPLYEIPSLNSSRASSTHSFEIIHPKPPDPLMRSKGSSLKEHIENDISSVSLNTTVTLLVAGAIFAIVIIFLQWLRDISAGFDYSSTVVGGAYNAQTHTMQERCQILQTYLNLKVGFAVASACSIVRTSQDALAACLDIPDMPSSIGQYYNDNLSETEAVAGSTRIGQAIDLSDIVSQPLSSSRKSCTSQAQLPRKILSNAHQTFCRECHHLFRTVSNYNKHLRDKHKKVRYRCRYCERNFSRNAYRKEHEKKKHQY